MNLILRDSQYLKGKEEGSIHTALYCQAIDILKRSIANNEMEIISLSSGSKDHGLDQEIIWYEITGTTSVNRDKKAVANKAIFYTSHFIGTYTARIGEKNISIEIKPRFGSRIFNYLISYAYKLYLPKSDLVSSENTEGNSLWLIALMWKGSLEKAMTKSQIPKEYKRFENNSSRFKGKLNISRHIRENIVDKSKFYCSYRKQTMDTTINQVIRYTYRLLLEKQSNINALLKDIAVYDNKLHTFGVQERAVPLSEIKNIRYSKLNFHYKKVMELSKVIIQDRISQSNMSALEHNSFSYFLDIAEVWEDYLLKLLQRGLVGYNVYSPNDRGGEFLIIDAYREIRPDILIEKEGEIVAILDAKYKWYNNIGKYASSNNAVSRDDLYQMTTYLYHYARSDKKVLGLFISPMHQNIVDTRPLNSNSEHRIGVLNLDIEQFNGVADKENKEAVFSVENIHAEEEKFIEKIKKELDQ